MERASTTAVDPIAEDATGAIAPEGGEAFCSVLFPTPALRAEAEGAAQPACFPDLNLDQIVGAIVAGRDAYDLAPFFHLLLPDADAVRYRQEVMRDLDEGGAMPAVQAFAAGMRRMRAHLGASTERSYAREQQRWFLDAAVAYCGAVEALLADLRALPLRSRALRRVRAHLTAYVASSRFVECALAARSLTAALAAIRYGLRIEAGSVTVQPYAGEDDYGAIVAETFAPFRREPAKDYRVAVVDRGGLNHVEAEILDRVALLHPEPFAALARFRTAHADFVAPTIAWLDREIQFYVAYLEHMAEVRRAGLVFCYPQVSADDKAVCSRQGFDLALARKLIGERRAVVCNDFALHGPERIMVVTGPNQGGKTTFARTFGQMHYLAALGCPVPGREARLLLCDRVFTHFEREEDLATRRGKLEDDLVRMRDILAAATERSIVVINEIFTSTTLRDALALGRRILGHLSRLDLLAVCVTFLDELATFDEKTVSIVGGVEPDDPAVRTYRLERRPADGLAHALALAEAHRVTRAWLRQRIRE
ncbi:DNA mismatch repair protein MutS [bacterium]|nr:DNA mismatch repair protein MutS [bacterium]